MRTYKREDHDKQISQVIGNQFVLPRNDVEIHFDLKGNDSPYEPINCFLNMYLARVKNGLLYIITEFII